MKPLTIPQGAEVLIGQPARPMPQDLTDAIRKLTISLPGILEAYLPQCYIQGIVDPPAQILILVLDDINDHKILDAIDQGLARILPEDAHLDVLPLALTNDLLSAARNSRTHLHSAPPAQPKRWWKILVCLFIVWFLWRVMKLLLSK